MASKKDESVIKEPFSLRFASFLNKYKIVLFSILGVLIAVALVLIIVFSVKASREKALYRAFSPIEQEYNEVRNTDEDSRDYTDVLEKLNGFINTSSSYPILASLYMRANIYAEEGEFEKAFEDYKTLYERSSKDAYYSDTALFSMATMKDAEGDEGGAYELYKKVWSDYGKSSAYASRALFLSLRYAEKINDSDAVLEFRDALIEDYSFTDYGRYADNLKKAEEDAKSADSNLEQSDNQESLDTTQE